MKKRLSRQLELFGDGARAIAAAKTVTRTLPDESRLQAKLDDARRRLREILILGMKTWLPQQTRKELRETEGSARKQVMLHLRVLEDFRERRRRHP
jgi:hypothetical protein